MRALAGWLRRPWVAAGLTGFWMVVAADPTAGPLAWAAFPVAMAGVWLSFRHPVVGASLVLVASLGCTVSGAAYGALEALPPTLWALFWLRRRSSSWVFGVAFVLGFTFVTSLRAGAEWYALPTGLIVYSIPWLFGRLVWSRERAARRATEETARLAGTDLQRLLRASSEATRRSATHASLIALQVSVSSMCDLVRAALVSLDPAGVESIRREGAEAIATLHRILRSLQAPRFRIPQAHTAPEVVVSKPRSRHLPLPVIGGIAGGGLLLVNPITPLILVVAACLVLAGLTQRRFPLLGAIATAAALLVAAQDAPRFPEPIAIWLAASIWHLACLDSVPARVGGILAVVAALPLGILNGKEGVAFVVLIVLLAMVAAWGWREHDRIVRAEQERLARLLAAIATAQLRLDERARAHLASELHDGSSHGITAMTLQTQAALAHAERDPAQSRRALELALRVGRQTLAEITALAETNAEGQDARERDIGTLIEGLRVLDVRIECFHNGRLALPAATDALTYRIVQESLTNALRHAPGAAITIRIDDRDAEREVRVTTRLEAGSDSATPTEAEQILASIGLSTGLGSGLKNLAERVRARRGVFMAGPVDEAFQVHAHWPQSTPSIESDANTLTEANRS